MSLPNPWSARDGATEPYMDVFTGVFWEAYPFMRPSQNLKVLP